MIVRKVEIEDAAPIVEIYNFYVLNSHSTFETEAVETAEMQKRVEEVVESYPYFVAEENEEILGYAFANQYKSRCAYKNSAEVSVYVKNDLKQKGIGGMLYDKLLAEILRTDVHALVAGIALPNDASIKLHERFGFEKVAHFREIGFKFGRWIDVGYWELINKK
jgi:phosphinothricin acetyltransferase